MSNPTPFILHILVADGDPDGLRIVERSNWSGKALMFPRALYTQVRSRSEFKQPGVYLLIGPRTDGDGDMLYIGEGDPVWGRFETHYAQKDFWTRAVFFGAGLGQLNKAHVQYLEAQLVNRARAAKRMALENANTPTEPTLSEIDRAYMEVFLQNLLGMLPVLNIHAFEQSPLAAAKSKSHALICQGRGIKATGYDTPQGFVVQSGSLAASDEVPSLKEHFPNVCKLRADLLKSGVLIPAGDKFHFTQDYTFSSPSMASALVLGRPSNGRTDWKDANGKTLKELQEAQAKSG
jgi:hypothetical protein